MPSRRSVMIGLGGLFAPAGLPGGLRLWKAGGGPAMEARFSSIKSFPERFALWQMGSLIGDLMQPALQYSTPFLLTLGVHLPDPHAMQAVVTANHVRATQNARSKMAEVMPDVGRKLQDWAAAARIIYPDADGAGTQVNVSGAILAKYAPNKENGEKLIEFLLSDAAQQIYANGNYEYPVVPGVKASDLVESWGALNANKTPLTDVASHRAEAAALVDELKFNEGAQN